VRSLGPQRGKREKAGVNGENKTKRKNARALMGKEKNKRMEDWEKEKRDE